MINILVFPSGSLVAKEIYDALKYEKNIELYGTDAAEDNMSSYFLKNYIPGCPFIKDKEKTIEFLKTIVAHHSISYIFPAFDSVISFLKENENLIGATILAPSLEVIRLCDSKFDTYNLLNSVIPTPQIYSNTDHSLQFPLYIKPIIGYGSRNHRIANSFEELVTFDASRELLLECLQGDEYTVDCFSNSAGDVLYAYARQRIKTLNGISVQSKTVFLPEAITFAKKIQTVVQMRGAWFFQVKYAGEKNTQLKLLEIACRIPGAMCVNRVKGINFPLLTLLDYQGIDVNPILSNNYEVDCHKLYTNSYKCAIEYNAVYCDLDDTLIIKDKVNTSLVCFLYKCLNKGIKLHLITRNPNPKAVLDEKRLNLFDSVVKLSKEKSMTGQYIQKKSEYIDKYSIFIDDSFVERYDVKTSSGCHVFSPAEIELLSSTSDI